MADKQNFSGDKPLHCSFCGKSQHEVHRLIEGKVGSHFAFICDECVKQSSSILQEELKNDAAACASDIAMCFTETRLFHH